MRTKDLLKYILIGAITLFAVVMSIYQQKKKRDLLSLDQKYVVGIVIKKEFASRGDPLVVYTYMFNNMKYKREEYDLYLKEGGRYLVSLPEGHEDEGIILSDHPVPKGINSPPNGWDKMPDFKD